MILEDDFTVIPNAVLCDHHLTAAERLIYFGIAMRAFGAKREAYPSQTTIANDLGLHRATVNAAISKLVTLHLLDKHCWPGRKTLTYSIQLPVGKSDIHRRNRRLAPVV